MWIKWKYNDHGHPDFKELEVPTETHGNKTYYGGEESVEDYICERGLVPTWSERFMVERIKWMKLKAPSKETVEAKIKDLQSGVKWRRNKVKKLQALLKTL